MTAIKLYNIHNIAKELGITYMVAYTLTHAIEDPVVIGNRRFFTPEHLLHLKKLKRLQDKRALQRDLWVEPKENK